MCAHCSASPESCTSQGMQPVKARACVPITCLFMCLVVRQEEKKKEAAKKKREKAAKAKEKKKAKAAKDAKSPKKRKAKVGWGTDGRVNGREQTTWRAVCARRHVCSSTARHAAYCACMNTTCPPTTQLQV